MINISFRLQPLDTKGDKQRPEGRSSLLPASVNSISGQHLPRLLFDVYGSATVETSQQRPGSLQNLGSARPGPRRKTHVPSPSNLGDKSHRTDKHVGVCIKNRLKTRTYNTKFCVTSRPRGDTGHGGKGRGVHKDDHLQPVLLWRHFRTAVRTPSNRV